MKKFEVIDKEVLKLERFWVIQDACYYPSFGLDSIEKSFNTYEECLNYIENNSDDYNDIFDSKLHILFNLREVKE